MATSFKLFVLLLLGFIMTANSQTCNTSSVTLDVTTTKEMVGPDPVFEVEIKNTCTCSASNIIIVSLGFSSSSPVDSKLFRREGNDYVVNDRKAIPSMQSVKFRYSWDRAFSMSIGSVKFDSC